MSRAIRWLVFSFLIIIFFGSTSYWQELTCEERYFDIEFTIQQNFSSLNYSWDIKEFTELFTKEYYLVNLAAVDCDDCINEAEYINDDNQFQRYFWISWSCDFGTFVDYWSLSWRVDEIWSWTFISNHSYEFTWMNTYYFPQLFNSPVADELPTFILLGRDAQVVRRYTWELPRYLISDYCIEIDECLEEEEEEEESDNGDDDVGDTGGDDWWSDPDTWTPWWSNNGGEWEPWTWPWWWWQWGEWWSGPWWWWEWWGWDGPSVWIDSTPIQPWDVTIEPWRLQIEIPWEAERDVITWPSQITTANSYNALRITRRQINSRLWILFGVALLAAILYAWFKFITAAWDPEKSKAALKTFIYIWAAFAIALFAFIIVRLITNIFIT